jgi:queuine/archaeosine tRNA-ribosyltransferase
VAERTQVFLCYGRPDIEQALTVYGRLGQEGLRPWIDKRSLKPGDAWEKRIRAAIRDSEYVLVLLTKRSVNRRGFLQKEIKEALDIQDEQLDTDRFAIPVRLEPCAIPERLAHIQSADLYEPDGWDKLLEILSDTSAGAKENGEPKKKAGIQRLEQLSVGGVATPCFFPSVSGAAKNNLNPIDHLQILVKLKHPLFLVSAYDIDSTNGNDRIKISRLLNRAASQGQIILMDSGLYEKKWLRAKVWPRSHFHHILRNSACHLAFCYDNPDPPTGISTVANEIKESVIRAKRISKFEALIPIVHSKSAKRLSEICVRVAKGLNPPLVAVPERELGESVRSCAVMIAQVRKVLNEEMQSYVPLHVLGTGNPLSILVYSWAGADSFDGLDWCQTAVDYKMGRLYHSLQLDFFTDQSGYASDRQISYMTRLLGHNLEFYKAWMDKIQDHLKEGTIDLMLDKYLPDVFLSDLRKDISKITE